MRDGHERLGALPRAAPGEVDHAVLRGQIIRLRARRRDDIAAEVRQDARVAHALDVMQMNALPPRAMAAPVRKSSWPPVPLIWRRPELSDATCP